MELVPAHGIATQRQAIGSLVDGDVHHAVLHIGHHAFAPDVRALAQFNLPHNAVPVALRLVGYAMRILTHAHVLDAIVHLDGKLVGLAVFYIRCNIVNMRHRQRLLMPYPLTIHHYRGLDMRALQVQHHRLPFPLFGHHHRALVPGITHVMLVGG